MADQPRDAQSVNPFKVERHGSWYGLPAEDVWYVKMRHDPDGPWGSCDEDQGIAFGLHDEAVAELERFIAHAEVALRELRDRNEIKWVD